MEIKGKDIRKARRIFENFKIIIDRINNADIDKIIKLLIDDGCPAECANNYSVRFENFKKFYQCQISTRLIYKYWEYFFEDNLEKCPAPHGFIKKVCFDNGIEYNFVALFYIWRLL